MSAIGDYIFLTYRDYAFGDSPEYAKRVHHRHSLMLNEAYKSADQKAVKVDRAMDHQGNVKQARELERILNNHSDYLKEVDKNTSDLNKINFASRLEKAFKTANNAKYQQYTINSNLSVNALDSDVVNRVSQYLDKQEDALNLIRDLSQSINKFSNSLDIGNITEAKLFYQNDQEKKQVQKLLNMILSINSLRKDDEEGKAEFKEIIKAGQELQNYIKLGGRQVKKSQMSSLSRILATLYNKLIIVPPIALGDLGEIFVAEAIKNAGIAGLKKVTVVGGDSSIPVLLTDLFTKNKDAQQDIFQMHLDKVINNPNLSEEVIKSLESHGTYGQSSVFGQYLEMAPKETQEGIDVLIETETGNMSVSVKNYKQINDVTILSGMKMGQMVQLDNENDFINHYINVMAPHYEMLYRQELDNGEKVSMANNSLKQQEVQFNKSAKKAVKAMQPYFTLIMNRLLLAKALTRYNTVKIRNGQVGFVPMSDYFAVNLRPDESENEWNVWSMAEVYYWSLTNEAFHYGSVKSNKDPNPFPQNRFYKATPPYRASKEKAAEINQRIVSIVHRLNIKTITMHIDLKSIWHKGNRG